MLVPSTMKHLSIGSSFTLLDRCGVTGYRIVHYITWHCSVLASSEYASLIEREDDLALQGVVVLPLEGEPCHIEYDVLLDNHWRPRSCDVRVNLSTQVQTINLRSNHVGRWELNGEVAPHLDGCEDLDLGWTPATNTVPIRRLDLKVGGTADINAAWIRFPELDVVASEQHYARLAPHRWRYQSGDFDFELETDAASGLVLAYGDDLWTASARQLNLREP
jgi:uncharacterized protein